MHPLQAIVYSLCQSAQAESVVLIIVRPGLKHAEVVNASQPGCHEKLPDQLVKIAEQMRAEFAALDAKVN